MGGREGERVENVVSVCVPLVWISLPAQLCSLSRGEMGLPGKSLGSRGTALPGRLRNAHLGQVQLGGRVSRSSLS